MDLSLLFTYTFFKFMAINTLWICNVVTIKTCLSVVTDRGEFTHKPQSHYKIISNLRWRVRFPSWLL